MFGVYDRRNGPQYGGNAAGGGVRLGGGNTAQRRPDVYVPPPPPGDVRYGGLGPGPAGGGSVGNPITNTGGGGFGSAVGIGMGGDRSGRGGPDNGGPRDPNWGQNTGGGGVSPDGGIHGVPKLGGASAAWRAQREAAIAANKAKLAAAGPAGQSGFMVDPTTKNPWYSLGPNAPASVYQSQGYKDWLASMVNPQRDAFSARRLPITGPSFAQPVYTPPATPPPTGGSGAGSVTETPSTHAPSPQPVTAPAPVYTPPPFFPLGQSGMTAPAQSTTKAAQYGAVGGGPQATGSQPGQGFAPANAPGSQQATAQGAMYGGRTNRMAQQKGIADYNQRDPNAARRPSPFTTFMPSDYRNNQIKYGGM